jgi:hypothetical protein
MVRLASRKAIDLRWVDLGQDEDILLQVYPHDQLEPGEVWTLWPKDWSTHFNICTSLNRECRFRILWLLRWTSMFLSMRTRMAIMLFTHILLLYDNMCGSYGLLQFRREVKQQIMINLLFFTMLAAWQWRLWR